MNLAIFVPFVHYTRTGLEEHFVLGQSTGPVLGALVTVKPSAACCTAARVTFQTFHFHYT